MSHPDPQHDAENTHEDDSILAQEIEWRRREDERDAWDEAHAYDSARDCSIATAAAADNRPRAAGAADGFGNYGPDLGIDGSYGYRERIYNAQMRANAEYSQRQKERK